MKLLWDFGGVLLRWRPRALVRRALPHFPGDDAHIDQVCADVFQGFGGDWAEFDRGTVAADALVQRIAQRTGLRTEDVRAVVQAVPEELQPLSESVALVEALAAAGHQQYYLSNMPAPFADGIQRDHPFLRHFVGGVFSGHVGVIKPEPAIFELCCQRFGLLPAGTLFIDDHPANIAAAARLGWQVHHFQGAAGAEAEFRRLGLL